MKKMMKNIRGPFSNIPPIEYSFIPHSGYMFDSGIAAHHCYFINMTSPPIKSKQNWCYVRSECVVEGRSSAQRRNGHLVLFPRNVCLLAVTAEKTLML